MGTSFVGKARDVWQMADAQDGEGGGDIVEFQAQVSGHEANEKTGRTQAVSVRMAKSKWYLSDWQLADNLEKDRPILLLPGSWWTAPARV